MVLLYFQHERKADNCVFDFKETWDYLQSLKQMDFAMQFDNIAILKKENDKWIPDQVWELPMG